MADTEKIVQLQDKSGNKIYPVIDSNSSIKDDSVAESKLSTEFKKKISDKVTEIKNTITANEKASKIEKITYSDLCSLRNSNGLIPGKQYQITDYHTTTTQENTQSANHQFDIIVVADSTSKLNETARAIQHDGDTYFSSSNLAAWKIWYCLDNDTKRFAWADSTNGKGVIYRMIDEYNNDCPYDFKNIQFKRFKITEAKSSDLVGTYLGIGNNSSTGIKIDSNDSKMFYTFSYLGELGELTDYEGEILQDASIVGNNTLSTTNTDSEITYDDGVHDNSIKQYVIIPDDTTSNSTASEETTLAAAKFNIMSAEINTESNTSYAPNFTIDENANTNTITAGKYSTVTVKRTFNANAWNTLVLPFDLTAEQLAAEFGTDAKFAAYTGTTKNNDGTYTLNFKSTSTLTANIPVFVWGANNKGVYEFSDINVVKADPTSTPSDAAFSFTGSYDNTTLKAGDWFISSDNKFYRALGTETMKPMRAVFRPVSAAAAKGLLFAINLSSKTTSINVQSLNNIVFLTSLLYEEYEGCNSNSFGNNCYSNSFGNSCNSNLFGNDCYSNSFGNDCDSNSFGNDCDSNSFGNGCYSNSFGNYCNSNSFGNDCYSNSFGNDCYSNSFGNNCYSNSFGNHCYSNSFGIDSSNNKLDAYYKYNKFDNGVQYVTFNGTGTSSKYVQNYHIKQGMTFTSSSKHTITAKPGLGYELSVAKLTDGTVVEYCEADLSKTIDSALITSKASKLLG